MPEDGAKFEEVLSGQQGGHDQPGGSRRCGSSGRTLDVDPDTLSGDIRTDYSPDDRLGRHRPRRDCRIRIGHLPTG